MLHETNGRRTIVSHFNKATKGRIVRELLAEGAEPRGRWTRSPTPCATSAGPSSELGHRLDVVVAEV